MAAGPNLSQLVVDVHSATFSISECVLGYCCESESISTELLLSYPLQYVSLALAQKSTWRKNGGSRTSNLVAGMFHKRTSIRRS